MSDNKALVVTAVLLVLGVLLPIVLKFILDRRHVRRVSEKVSEAERQAFQTIPESIVAKRQELFASDANPEQRAKEIERLRTERDADLQMGSLMHLCSKQIEKYQIETQSRAGWSFIFGILAMVAGLGFVFWGGSQIIEEKGWMNVAAGSIISTIGAAISTYISKTFLDIHKLSLNQLNRYFKQPVLNANILTAQRVADLMRDYQARQDAYRDILSSVLSLIKDDKKVND